MPYIIKTNPFDASPGDCVPIAEKAELNDREVRRADEAFIWCSETRGGRGLTWQSHVASVEEPQDRKFGVSVHLTNRARTKTLGKDDLAPFRDVRDGEPLSKIARKLYFQSHNKIAEISHEEADFLRQYFRP